MGPKSEGKAKPAGTVEAIYISPYAGKPMLSLSKAAAIAGRGLEGDRYLKDTGYYSGRPLADGGRQITLFEAEEIDRLRKECGIRLDPAESRRNVLTRSIGVNGLIGKTFRIGEILCEGTAICEPCTYLEKLTGKSVMRPLVHRGGLRARIVSGGILRVGDEITPAHAQPVEELEQPRARGAQGPETASSSDPEEVQADGVLRRLELPSPAGGTHYLETEGARTALCTLLSDELELDDYIGVKVRAFGYAIGGNAPEGPVPMRVYLIGAL